MSTTSSPSSEHSKTFIHQLVENGQGKEEDLRELLPGIDLQSLLRQRATVVQQIRQALDVLDQAENTARQACIGFPHLSASSRCRCRYAVTIVGPSANRAPAEAAMTKEVDGPAWEFLMQESGIHAFMGSDTRNKWTHAIRLGDFPEFERSAITAVFGQLHAGRNAMREQSVLGCLHRLSWDYNAHLPRQLGEKIIVQHLTQNDSLQEYAGGNLDDLERVFCLLDGKPESVQRGSLPSIIHAAQRAQMEEAETSYLQMRWYRNGNGHITFKRRDLVEKMNAILVAHEPGALPAPVGKRAKR
ncbi:MAG: DUF4942 domain-containing protein [Azoarcus sp.]|nr:DUF4942 domain-containing protein [Azoarcus sp.]